MKENYNIKTNIPKISSDQIHQHQDFDALLAQFNQAAGEDLEKTSEPTPIHPIQKARPVFIKYLSAASITIAASIMLVFMIRQSVRVLQPPTQQIQEQLALAAPIKDLAPAYEEMQVPDAMKGAVLQHPSGSKIVVPTAAFVDEKGETVKGKVDIAYRQFDDHVDMFLAGVPKEQDKHQNLQSVGMMEIKATQNGKPVYIGMDKTLEVQLQSRVLAALPTSELEVYVYSKAEDQWQYTADDIVKLVDVAAQEETPEVDMDEIQAQAAAQLADRRPELPRKPEPVPTDMELFDFEINKEEFPELAYLDQNIQFIVAQKDVADNPFAENWHGMELKALGNNTIELQLIKEDATGSILEERSFHIHPFIAYSVESQARYEAELEVYATRLEQWEGDVAATAAQLQKQKSVAPVLKTIVNTFQINRFGLWNCGKDVLLDESLKTTVNMVDAQGQAIDVAQLFIINQAQQLYYFTRPDDIKIDAQTAHKVWALTTEDELLVATIPQNKGKDLTFEFESKGAVRSAEQARELLTF